MGAWALQGWGSKATNQSSIAFTLTFVNNIADKTKWATCDFFGPTDEKVQGNAGGPCYRLLIRQNGEVKLFKVTGGTATEIAGSAMTTAAIGEGGTAKFKIEVVEATKLKIIRVDTSESKTVTDSTYRGGYFHFGVEGTGLKAAFSEVVTT